MKQIIPLLVAGLAASACATTQASRLPVCDGQHLRPANPNGSVLEPGTTGATTAAPASPPAAQPGCGA